MNEPSKFVLSEDATEDDIWAEIIRKLPKDLACQADKKNSYLTEPYIGAKEYIIKNNKGKELATASISDKHGKDIDWSIYKDI